MEDNNKFAYNDLFLIDYISNKVITDLELFAHFMRCIDYMVDDICYVSKQNYESFVEKLSFKDSTPEFSARIGYLGYIQFNINDIRFFLKIFHYLKKFLKNN